jgi:hypothetical protein
MTHDDPETPDERREPIRAAIEKVRADHDFTDRARRLLARDRELVERLGRGDA